MTIHARFRLDQVTRGRGYYKAPGEQETAIVEAANVELGAVQGEPFGSATPSGKLQMFIVNPSASEVFFGLPIGTEFDVLLSPVKTKE
jgi:hypothetical protein